MNEKPVKTVLIVDDEPSIRQVLSEEFQERSSQYKCPFRFEVTEASTSTECISKIREKRLSGIPDFDVVVVDISLEGGEEGLHLSVLMSRGFSCRDEVVRIIFTGYRDDEWLIHAMRAGVWDYILKKDTKGPGGYTLMSEKVVDSAIKRLQMLDLRDTLEQHIAVGWYPKHYQEVHRNYTGKLIALWHDPEVEVVASGKDEFELQANLHKWREGRHEWQQPFIMKID